MAISITKRREFIQHIFAFFKIESTDNLVSTYDLALTTKYPVDWEAFYEEIVKTTEKRILPMPKYFSDRIGRFKKQISTGVHVEKGRPVRIYLKNGTYYDFEVDNIMACTSLESVKKRYEYKDEKGNTATNLQKIVIYPKGTTLIGEKAFFDTRVVKKLGMSDEEYESKVAEKENELKAQVKILFCADNN